MCGLFYYASVLLIVFSVSDKIALSRELRSPPQRPFVETNTTPLSYKLSGKPVRPFVTGAIERREIAETTKTPVTEFKRKLITDAVPDQVYKDFYKDMFGDNFGFGESGENAKVAAGSQLDEILEEAKKYSSEPFTESLESTSLKPKRASFSLKRRVSVRKNMKPGHYRKGKVPIKSRKTTPKSSPDHKVTNNLEPETTPYPQSSSNEDKSSTQPSTVSNLELQDTQASDEYTIKLRFTPPASKKSIENKESFRPYDLNKPKKVFDRRKEQQSVQQIQTSTEPHKRSPPTRPPIDKKREKRMEYREPESYEVEYLDDEESYVDDDPVPFKELCSFDGPLTWINMTSSAKYSPNENCRLDDGPKYIPKANIPLSFAIHPESRRCFISTPSSRPGVYSRVSYFNLDDIKDRKCPTLRPYPSHSLNSLERKHCSESTTDSFIDVHKLTIDNCGKQQSLWFVDTGVLNYNQTEETHFKSYPSLVAIDLVTNLVWLRRRIPPKLFRGYPHGLLQVSVNVANDDCSDTFAVIADSFNGLLIYYSTKTDQFWRFKSPYFYANSIYGPAEVNNRANEPIQYFIESHVFESTWDLENNQLILISRGSDHVVQMHIDDLHNETKATHSPYEVDINFIGDLPPGFLPSSIHYDQESGVVWTAHELLYGVGCWNLETGPYDARLVAYDQQMAPFVRDLKVVNLALSDKEGAIRRIFVLSNDEQHVKQNGVKKGTSHFSLLYLDVAEVLKQYPECQAKKSRKL